MSSINQGDLRGALIDTVSIDQYKAKLDEDNIVVAFTFRFLEAANDVREFIDRGDFGVLDTEVILTADLFNNYQLLIEFNRDKTFLHYILKLCKYLYKMSDVQKFKFVSYLTTKYITLNRANILKTVRLIKVDKQELVTRKMLFKFFNTNIEFIKDGIIVPCYGGRLKLRYVGQTTDELIESFVKVHKINLLDQEKLEPIFLGDHYHILNFGTHLTIKNTDTDVILMFKNLGMVETKPKEKKNEE